MTDEEAKAVQEVAKLADAFGGFVSRILGTVPEDTVGILGGDYLRHIRIRNATRLQQRTDEILRERGIAERTIPVSPRIAFPLIEAAWDETREELQELWARLLANALDPNNRTKIRRSYIAIIRDFEPLDAVLLKKLCDTQERSGNMISIKDWSDELGISHDEFYVSVRNLIRLGCAQTNRLEAASAAPNQLVETPLGRELVRACMR